MRPARVASFLVVLLAIAFFSFTPTDAFAQYVVDCTGNTPGAYTTINSVLPLLTNGSVVRITGPCTENVTITGLANLNIGAPWGQTATLNGNLTLNSVQNLFLYGMNVTDPSGDGIDISNSSAVTLDNCASSNNTGFGLNVSDSAVTIQGTGAFNNNGSDGIYASGITDLEFGWCGGPVSISNNLGDGLYLQDGKMEALGGLTISGNKTPPNDSPFAPPAGNGFGINFRGHARGAVLGFCAPNVISGNQAGGVAIYEGSEISISFASDLPAGDSWGNIISGNGSAGVTVGLGSQATFWEGAQITNHPDAGIDVFGHSQAFIYGPDQIASNGTGSPETYPTRAGVRVAGNSEAYIRGGQISQNDGPGILELDNSSVDISGATLTSNLGGPIVCDSSAWLVSDPATVPALFGFAAPCKMPNTYGPHVRAFSPPPIPNSSPIQAQEAKYQKLISSF